MANVTLRDNETMMKVDLAEPLAPGSTATFDVAWHFLIPEHGADRMGRDGALYELAQWYPRVNVYDDVRGWNTEPYLGQGEFYLEYGDFTLPSPCRRATSSPRPARCTNPREVLTPTEIARLAQAAKSDTPVHIITPRNSRAARRGRSTTGHDDLEVRGEERARRRCGPRRRTISGTQSSWKGIDGAGVLPPAARSINWDDAADQARMSIEEYSERWYPVSVAADLARSRARSAAWSIRCSRWKTKSQDKYDLYNVDHARDRAQLVSR